MNADTRLWRWPYGDLDELVDLDELIGEAFVGPRELSLPEDAWYLVVLEGSLPLPFEIRLEVEEWEVLESLLLLFLSDLLPSARALPMAPPLAVRLPLVVPLPADRTSLANRLPPLAVGLEGVAGARK